MCLLFFVVCLIEVCWLNMLCLLFLFFIKVSYLCMKFFVLGLLVNVIELFVKACCGLVVYYWLDLVWCIWLLFRLLRLIIVDWWMLFIIMILLILYIKLWYLIEVSLWFCVFLNMLMVNLNRLISGFGLDVWLLNVFSFVLVGRIVEMFYVGIILCYNLLSNLWYACV